MVFFFGATKFYDDLPWPSGFEHARARANLARYTEWKTFSTPTAWPNSCPGFLEAAVSL